MAHRVDGIGDRILTLRALGQPGLHRDARHGPAVIGPRLDHDVPASEPQTEHHRDLVPLEQHADGFGTQMIQTPSRQPLRQIVQRHTEDCATGTAATYGIDATSSGRKALLAFILRGWGAGRSGGQGRPRVRGRC